MGSGIRNVGGTALLYTSTDMINWTYRGPLYVGNYREHPATGQVWELPVLLPLGEDRQGNTKHILLINPWWEGYSPYHVKYVWYWIGSWDKANYRFVLDDAEPQLFDYGEHFTGPSGLVDPRGRSIVFSITQDRRTEYEHYPVGWAHNAGLPIALSLAPNDTLRVDPIPELTRLRNTRLAQVNNVSMAEANRRLANVKGDLLEITAILRPVTATRFGLKLRQSPDGAEETLLFYDTKQSTLGVDRTRSSLDPPMHARVSRVVHWS